MGRILLVVFLTLWHTFPTANPSQLLCQVIKHLHTVASDPGLTEAQNRAEAETGRQRAVIGQHVDSNAVTKGRVVVNEKVGKCTKTKKKV